jgi:hypothetical protein
MASPPPPTRTHSRTQRTRDDMTQTRARAHAHARALPRAHTSTPCPTPRPPRALPSCSRCLTAAAWGLPPHSRVRFRFPLPMPAPSSSAPILPAATAAASRSRAYTASPCGGFAHGEGRAALQWPPRPCSRDGRARAHEARARASDQQRRRAEARRWDGTSQCFVPYLRRSPPLLACAAASTFVIRWYPDRGAHSCRRYPILCLLCALHCTAPRGSLHTALVQRAGDRPAYVHPPYLWRVRACTVRGADRRAMGAGRSTCRGCISCDNG